MINNPTQYILAIINGNKYQNLYYFVCTGHLARTKVIPSFYKLYTRGLIPDNFSLLGYSRSKLTDSTFRDKIKSNLSHDCITATADQLTPSMIDRTDDDNDDKNKSYLESIKHRGSSAVNTLAQQLNHTLQFNPATHELNVQKFLSHCHYHPGQYDKSDDIQSLDQKIKDFEHNRSGNRIFYLAIPPEIFGMCSHVEHHNTSYQFC